MNAKINLAPEVYQNSQRSKQRKRVAAILGGIVSVSVLALVAVAAVVFGTQKVYLLTVNGDIKKLQQRLDEEPDLVKAVTAQQHLLSVVDLYNNRAYISRFFENMQDVLPTGVALESLEIGNDNLVTISGSSQSFAQANKFAKALQADNVEIGADAAPSKPPYFTDITLASADAAPNGTVSFKITAQMSGDVTAAASSGSGGNNGK